jgi:4-hydroxybenzoate polyprenyltransferase
MPSIGAIDVKIRYGYARLKRKIEIYFTLWFLALLAGVSLVIDSIFVSNDALPLKIWSVILVLLLALKLAYDASANARKQYFAFKEEHNITDSTLKKL